MRYEEPLTKQHQVGEPSAFQHSAGCGDRGREADRDSQCGSRGDSRGGSRALTAPPARPGRAHTRVHGAGLAQRCAQIPRPGALRSSAPPFPVPVSVPVVPWTARGAWAVFREPAPRGKRRWPRRGWARRLRAAGHQCRGRRSGCGSQSLGVR